MLALMDGNDLTLAEATELRDLALFATRSDVAVAATPDELANHLRFIDATLPRRNADEETGRQRFAVYARMLSGYSNDALAFMSLEILRNYDWFPSPRQCIEAVERYSPPSTVSDQALMIAGNRVQVLFDEWFERLRTETVEQAEIDAVPDRWLRIAETRSALRWTTERGYFQRVTA